jgi:hypothetical protein
VIKRQVVFALTLTAVFAVRGDAREGFGLIKKAVDMTRTTAPGVNIAGTRFEVIASHDRSSDGDDTGTLRRYVQEAILEGDKRLSVAAKPEFTVRLVLSRSDMDENYEQETDVEYQRTGTKEEWNAKKQKTETKDVYENVEVNKTITVVTGIVDGTYRITDASGRDVESNFFTQKFSDKYESAPTKSTVIDALLHKAARAVAARLVPTHDRVSVIVPKGSFEALIPLAESGAWDRYLTGVEAVPENRSPDQEAYRQYALAVAKEAVAM